MEKQRACLAIDLKSFYGSVECVARHLDPLTTHLVVADATRTDKTICLAVTPSLKAYGIPGRARLFEVKEQIRQINAQRLARAPGRAFHGTSYNTRRLERDPGLELRCIIAPPRMSLYMQVSTQIYQIYLRFFAPEHIHVYSIDEVFIEATDYLALYRTTPAELAGRLMKLVLKETGITATAGVGTNLYLAKVAMDIVAKHIPADENGLRIAELNEYTYRERLWDHRPLTDFWRVGPGYIRRLEGIGLYTMGDIARCSLTEIGEDRLYDLFGVNAELLIDHAWGWEPCTMEAIKAYRPSSGSLGSGQVLHCPYDFAGARIIVREMTELLVLDLVSKHLVTDQIVLHVGFDRESMERGYKGPVKRDWYGRTVPVSAHGSVNLPRFSSSSRQITRAVIELYDQIVSTELLIRRVNVTATHVLPEDSPEAEPGFEQLDLFTDPAVREEEDAALEREHRLQEAMLGIQARYGKGATTRDRNQQIGGHKA